MSDVNVATQLQNLWLHLDKIPGQKGNAAKRMAAARWLQPLWHVPHFLERLQQLDETSDATVHLKQVLVQLGCGAGLPRDKAAREHGGPAACLARARVLHAHSVEEIKKLGLEKPCDYCGDMVSDMCSGYGHKEGCTKTVHAFCMTAHWVNVCRPASTHSRRERLRAAVPLRLTTLLAHPTLTAACFLTGAPRQQTWWQLQAVHGLRRSRLPRDRECVHREGVDGRAGHAHRGR